MVVTRRRIGAGKDFHFVEVCTTLALAGTFRRPLRGGLGDPLTPPVPYPTRADETAKLSRGVSVSYADKVLTCRDCGQSFVFTVGEQEFFASRGFTNDPSRCRDCRTARRGSGGGGGGGYSSGGGGYSSGGGGY